MAAKNFEEWVPFLNDVLAFWDENGLPATGSVMIGGVEMTRDDIAAMAENFGTYDPRIKKAERELERLQDSRVNDAAKIGKFGVNFRSAVIGRFGADSNAAGNVPVVSERRSSGARAAGKETSKVSTT